MPRPFAEGLRAHKQSILDDFLRMIPALEQALPGITLVLRPHPSEDHAVYHALAEKCTRVRVTHRGNVLPWLLACRALVHNGCTTAVESYAMGVPSVAYLATYEPAYDIDFLEELIAGLRAVLAGNAPPGSTPERDRLMDHYVAARTGRLASERILDVLDAAFPRDREMPPAASWRRLQASLLVRVKASLTKLNMHRPGPNRAAYHDHRFPKIGVADVMERVERLGRTLGRFGRVRARERGEHLFELFAAGNLEP
jgi:hypothetical protein